MTEEIVKRDPMVRALTVALAAPFDPKDVKFKPQMVKGTRCLAMAYIDARLIQDRLDEVVGPENWEDDYELLADGSVMCKLTLRLGLCMVTKQDVGSPSEQPDSGDRLKAAFSDALKRAAVKFGIGRYLYRLAAQWVDYDPVKKHIVQVPQLPAFAQPKKAQAQRQSQPAVATVATPVNINRGWATAPVSPDKQKEDDERNREKNIQDAKQWDVLISDPSLTDLNDALPKLKTMNEDVKCKCWEKTIALSKRKGWEFNAQTLKFEQKRK